MNNIIFLTSLLVTNIVLSLGFETFFYNVTVTRNNVLESPKINLTTRLNFIYYLTATSAENLTYLTGALNPTLDVYQDGHKALNSESCSSLATPLKELQQQFLILYNEDQTFKAIQVQKHESALVKNVKLLVSSGTQVDASKLNETETEVKAQAEELTVNGKCTIDYDAKRIQSLPGLNLQLNKRYDDKQCTRQLSSQAKEDISYLQDICKSEKESNFQESTNANLTIVFESISAFVTNTNLTTRSQFNPLKTTDAKVSSVLDFKADIITRNNTSVPPFNETNTIEVSRPSYRPINRSLLSEKNPKVDPKLQELYRSLACKASVKNSDYDLIERVITCLSNKKN